MKKRRLFNSKKPAKDNKPREPKPTPDPDVQAVAAILSPAERSDLFMQLFGQEVQVTRSIRRVEGNTPAEPRARTRYSRMGRLNFDDNITNDEED